MKLNYQMFRIYIGVVCFALFSSCVSLQKREVQLVVLNTNDTHSRIEPISSLDASKSQAGKGGYLRRAAFIEIQRAKNKNVLLLDCGDYCQGTPYFNLFHGEVEVRLMSEMGYDAAAIGNHEFDYGLENMARLFRLAKFPILCANYDFSGTPVEGLVHPYAIFERDGVKIGVFGLSPKMDGLVQIANCKGVGYKDPVIAANETAAILRAKGCKVVICLSHLGWKPSINDTMCDEALIPQTRGITFVLGGHSHSFINPPVSYTDLDGKSVSLTQLGKNGVYVGRTVVSLTHSK